MSNKQECAVKLLIRPRKYLSKRECKCLSLCYVNPAKSFRSFHRGVLIISFNYINCQQTTVLPLKHKYWKNTLMLSTMAVKKHCKSNRQKCHCHPYLILNCFHLLLFNLQFNYFQCLRFNWNFNLCHFLHTVSWLTLQVFTVHTLQLFLFK